MQYRVIENYEGDENVYQEAKKACWHQILKGCSKNCQNEIWQVCASKTWLREGIFLLVLESIPYLKQFLLLSQYLSNHISQVSHRGKGKI